MARATTDRSEVLRAARALLARTDAAIEGRSTPDAVAWAERALGISLDHWQEAIMRSSHDRLIVVAARQSGKSVITGAKAGFEAKVRPGLRVVVVAPSFRQSTLLADKIEDALLGSGEHVDRQRERLSLANGSTVQVLHGDRPATLRGHTADLLIVDELGFVKAELAPAILPMVQASRGRLIAISSPNGPSGPLYDLANGPGVEFMRIPASAVRHFDPAVIAEIRGRLGEQMARQELDAEFVASASSVFDADALDRMFGVSSEPLVAEDAALGERESALERRFRALQAADRRSHPAGLQVPR